jgi:hypothetical protein
VKRSETRSPRIDGDRAQAGRNIQAITNDTEILKALQSQRMRARTGCSDAVACELVRMVFGEHSQ